MASSEIPPSDGNQVEKHAIRRPDDEDNGSILKGDMSQYEDVAAQYAAPVEGTIDPVVTRRALRKIDTWVLPLLAVTTGLQYLDKSTLGYAAIFGLVEDTHLKGTDYSWLASIFYFGYLGMQPLAANLLQKFPAAKCLSISIFLWGVILFMHVVCNDWGKLMAVRFCLGIAEGIVTPAFILISSGWYARRDQPLRFGIWFSFNGIAQIVGGILSYGLGHIHVAGIQSWKWMYIVTASISIIWSIVIWFMLPDHQGKAWFLDEEEKQAAVEMIRSNFTGVYNSHFKKDQLIEALTDVKTWAFFFLALLWQVPNSIATFGSLVIKNFGYGSLRTTLLGMPAGAWEFVIMIAITYFSLRFFNTRAWCMIVSLGLALIGAVIVWAVPYHEKGALLTGYYLIYTFPTGYILLLSMASANIAGHTKKVVTNSMLLIGYSTGNIIGPQFFKSNQVPRYGLGIGSITVALAILIALTATLRTYLTWENKKRESVREAMQAERSERELAHYAFGNLTDKQNPLFVYVY